LFKRYPIIPPKQTEEGRRLTYRHQREAYQLISSDPYLKNHIPTFFGPVTIDDVIERDGTSIKDSYLLDCCYALEVVRGDETKMPLTHHDSSIGSLAHIKDAAERFAKFGVNVSDSSVFNAVDRERFKFIDF
jgi:hypothetical protein